MKQEIDSLEAPKAEVEQQKADVETSRNEAQKRCISLNTPMALADTCKLDRTIAKYCRQLRENQIRTTGPNAAWRAQ
jgi:hypothetical protein